MPQMIKFTSTEVKDTSISSNYSLLVIRPRIDRIVQAFISIFQFFVRTYVPVPRF